MTDEQQRLAYRAMDALKEAGETVDREKLAHSDPSSRRLAALNEIEKLINKAMQAVIDMQPH
jgi:hypothetical protein